MVRLQLEHLGMKIPDDQPVDLAKTVCPLNNALHLSGIGTGTAFDGPRWIDGWIGEWSSCKSFILEKRRESWYNCVFF